MAGTLSALPVRLEARQMRRPLLLIAALFALPLALGLAGPDDDAGARAEAQALLDKGAALFDSRNAAAMAATYIEDGSIIVIKRQHNASRGEVELQSFRGRAQIEKGYADIFKERAPEYRSRNTVDVARYLGPNVLLIHGRFAFNREQGDSIQFVQVRARVGATWQIVSMQLVPLAKDDP
jgi:hypothetical protein